MSVWIFRKATVPKHNNYLDVAFQKIKTKRFDCS
jgi:hypothetical protein